MSMKMRKFVALMGVTAFVFGAGLNVAHALNDYGVRENRLHSEILAQSSCSVDGSGTSDSSKQYFHKNTFDCKYSGKSGAFATITISLGVTVTADMSGNWEYTAHDADVHCTSGGSELCTPQNCPAFGGSHS